MIKDYYTLAKPGIVYGNVLTTVAAFLYATHSGIGSLHFFALFFAAVIGIGLVIASACVFNNYLDRDMDRKMGRTANRALVTGVISVPYALTYGSVLGIIGFALLALRVNLLTAIIGLFGFVMYVVVYGIAKRGSHYGALVGSISGAIPIVVGYTAVTGRLDLSAFILFLILAAWQMPHFYAIAIYRLDEYVAAGIPVLPAKKSIRETKGHILGYIILYVLATSLLFIFGYAGYVYLSSVLLFGGTWFILAIQGYWLQGVPDVKWARKVFFFSLIVLLAFSLTIALSPFLP